MINYQATNRQDIRSFQPPNQEWTIPVVNKFWNATNRMYEFVIVNCNCKHGGWCSGVVLECSGMDWLHLICSDSKGTEFNILS